VCHTSILERADRQITESNNHCRADMQLQCDNTISSSLLALFVDHFGHQLVVDEMLQPVATGDDPVRVPAIALQRFS
jgi:extradiol dioxygenase family protein